jgi:ribosomal protein L14E/L6E/L27E
VYLKRGQVVFSKAGHDKGSIFAVTSEDYPFAYISDGDKRPLERQKKKKQIHLIKTNYFVLEDDMRTNRALRKALRAYRGMAETIQ